MKYLLSLNNKFLCVNPDVIVQNTKQMKNIKGFEISFNILNEKETKYVKNLAKLCQRNNLILQFHGDITLKYRDNVKFINFINEISQGETNIVFHSIYSPKYNLSLSKTTKTLNNLLAYIEKKQFNITLSLENLNDIRGLDRFNKEDIMPILCMLPKLYFTYDIGHELIDENGNIKNIFEIHKARINNLHIHDYDNGKDHKIIKYKTKSFEIIKNILQDLKMSDKITCVFEYEILQYTSHTIKQKFLEYIQSVNYLCTKFNEL